jgi:hypothetical protein
MSFRHTFITEFLYKYGREDELKQIEEALKEFGTVEWRGHDGLGYFFGVMKDLDGNEMKSLEVEIKNKIALAGARVEIVFE